MTHQEAIKFCEGYLPDCDTKKFVLGELSKRDLKNAIVIKHGKFKTYKCPECSTRIFSYSLYPYCWVCGQRVDTSEGNEEE